MTGSIGDHPHRGAMVPVGESSGSLTGGGCGRSRALLSEWIDGDLPPRTSRAVTAHVEACRRCSALVLALRVVLAGLGALPADPPPAARRFGAGASVRRSPRIKWVDD